MKQIVFVFSLVLLSLSFLATSLPVEAKRLGGGSSSGMKRQTPPPSQAPQATPPSPTTPGNAAAAPAAAATTGAAAAAAGKRSWMGPLAGLAAGLGIAALMSHLGLGEGFGNFLTMILLALVAFVAIRFVMRRLGPAAKARAATPQGLQFAGMPMPPENIHGARFGSPSLTSPAAVTPVVNSAQAPVVGALPAGFDAPAFERIAKLIFIRMQAANDAGDLEDLRKFATPEMFATFKLDLQERAGSHQETDVVQLNAQVMAFAEEPAEQVVSVRFHGLIREVKDHPTTPFDEVWHLVKPTDGSREWAIAGISQSALA